MRVGLTQTQYKDSPRLYLSIACISKLITPACSARGPCAQYGGWRLDQASELLTDLAEDQARDDQVRRVELYI